MVDSYKSPFENGYDPIDEIDLRINQLAKLEEKHPEDKPTLEGIIITLQHNKELIAQNPVTHYPSIVSRDHDVKKILRRRRKGQVDDNIYVVRLDIDHFKRFNDRYGHEAGDEVLRITTQVLEETIRDTDFMREIKDNPPRAYHIHGEEKEIIFAAPDDNTAFKVAKRYRDNVKKLSYKRTNGKYTVTESVGITRWYVDKESFEKAIVRADKMVYTAKFLGRNRVASDFGFRNYMLRLKEHFFPQKGRPSQQVRQT